jgi:hemerythrin-like domain-containing protein
VTEGETRLVAWSRELRVVHGRLREALHVTRTALEDGQQVGPPPRELLLFCHGFCTALDGHHRGEDRVLFPAVVEEHAELAATVGSLMQDHSMIAHLIVGLEAAIDRAASPLELLSHLDGIGAIMESHFRYEERQLLAVLDGLDLGAEPSEALGPL